MARYHADGTPDATFGNGGLATTAFGPTDARAFGVVVQPDGKVVAAGQSSSSGGNFSFAVARYNPDGTPDAGFGNGGKLQFGFGAGTSMPAARDLALQPDGKIVVAGIFFNNSSNADIGIARLNPDGTFDAGFGSGGLVKADFQADEDRARRAGPQPDGKIVVAGLRAQPGGSILYCAFHADGTPDAGFGAGGRTITDLAAGDNDAFTAVVLQPVGTLVTAGTAGGGSDRNFGIAGYEAGPINPLPVADAGGPYTVVQGGAPSSMGPRVPTLIRNRRR